MKLDRKQLYRFLAESIGEKVVADNDEDIIKKANQAISGEYVDLGLPSGTLWAKYNVGASKEYEAGDYYAWGCTEPCNNGQNIKYDIPHKSLSDETDAATVQLGLGWRMPTKEEVEELFDYTYSCCGELKGVRGRFVFKVKDAFHKGKRDRQGLTSLYNKESDEYIFFPFNGYLSGSDFIFDKFFGYYWCRSYDCVHEGAWGFYLNSSKVKETVFEEDALKHARFNIRPVSLRKSDREYYGITDKDIYSIMAKIFR